MALGSWLRILGFKYWPSVCIQEMILVFYMSLTSIILVRKDREGGSDPQFPSFHAGKQDRTEPRVHSNAELEKPPRPSKPGAHSPKHVELWPGSRKRRSGWLGHNGFPVQRFCVRKAEDGPEEAGSRSTRREQAGRGGGVRCGGTGHCRVHLPC